MDNWVPVLIALLALPGAIVGAMAAARKVANDRAATQDAAINARYDQLQEDFVVHKRISAEEIAGLRQELRQERQDRRSDNDSLVRQGLIKDDYAALLRNWGSTTTEPVPRTPPPYPTALTA